MIEQVFATVARPDYRDGRVKACSSVVLTALIAAGAHELGRFHVRHVAGFTNWPQH